MAVEPIAVAVIAAIPPTLAALLSWNGTKKARRENIEQHDANGGVLKKLVAEVENLKGDIAEVVTWKREFEEAGLPTSKHMAELAERLESIEKQINEQSRRRNSEKYDALDKQLQELKSMMGAVDKEMSTTPVTRSPRKKAAS